MSYYPNNDNDINDDDINDDDDDDINDDDNDDDDTIHSGIRRSASATARPQRGRAGHAIDKRVSGLTSLIARIPSLL